MHNIQQYETGRAYNFNKMQFYNCFRVLWRDVKCKLLKGITTIHVYLTYTSSHLWNIFLKNLNAGIIWLAVFLFLWHVENILNYFILLYLLNRYYQKILKSPLHPLEQFCIQVHLVCSFKYMEPKHALDLKMTEKCFILGNNSKRKHKRKFLLLK